MEAIQVEVSNLMYLGERSRACKVTEIATALKETPNVVELYAYAEENKDDVNQVSLKFQPMVHFDECRRKHVDDEILRRKYEFFHVMDELEKSSTSIKTKVSTWEEAREALSVVLNFPDNTEKLDKKFAPLKQRWKQLRLQRLPSNISNVENRILKTADVKQHLKDRTCSLMPKFTQQEQSIVRNAIFGKGPPNQVIAQIGSDSVQRRSLQRLQPGKWLNDEVIHYFLIMLAKRDEVLCSQDSNRKPTHFFKSFFLTKLLNEGDADASKNGKYEYRNVKRWSKHVKGKDIFKLSKIVFPINQNQMHWICLVAFMDEKRIQVYDSIGSSRRSYLHHIFQYIKDEHMDKKGTPLPDADKWKLVSSTSDTPKQRNGKSVNDVDRLRCFQVNLLRNNSTRLRLWCVHLYVCGFYIKRLPTCFQPNTHHPMQGKDCSLHHEW
jgi:sentrin-specific protease 1